MEGNRIYKIIQSPKPPASRQRWVKGKKNIYAEKMNIAGSHGGELYRINQRRGVGKKRYRRNLVAFEAISGGLKTSRWWLRMKHGFKYFE